jgi:cell division protein FtsA
MDGSPVENPIGLSCETLELQLRLSAFNTDFAKQVTKVLRSLQIDVDKWIPVPLACGEALLTKEDKKNGVLWIDTGGECTDIAIYKDGIPIFTMTGFHWAAMISAGILLQV